MNKMCKGCWLYDNHGGCVYYKTILNKGKPDEIICPCTICLVKMMCDKTCSLLLKFRQPSHYIMKKRKEIINANSITKRE